MLLRALGLVHGVRAARRGQGCARQGGTACVRGRARRAATHRAEDRHDLASHVGVTEPPNVLDPPIDVLVLRTSDSHVGVHNVLASPVICISIISPKNA
jgi:hypothetical protein